MCDFYILGLVLLPILITDLVNPILLTGVLYGLGSNRPMVNSWIIIGAFFLSYFISGILIALGFDAFIDTFELTEGFAYSIELLVALLLIWIGYGQLKAGDTHPEEQLKHERSMSPWDAGLLGLQVNFVGLPFAIPYLAAIDQILKAEIDPFPSVAVLFLYNVLYLLPFVMMIGIKWFFKEKSKSILQKFNLFVHLISVKYLPWVFIGLALVLLEDCVSFLLGYREYSLLSLF